MLPVLLVLLLSLSAGVAAERPFFFFQLADPQFGMFNENDGFAQETANFEFAIATANRLRPAFVIVCGDLVHKPGEPGQIVEYLRVVGKIDPSIPLYHVAGNHDVGNEPTPESLATYRRTFGADYYRFQVQDMVGFILNSSVIHSPAQVPSELAKQETWLKTELEKAKKQGFRHLIVFQHHPWFLRDPEEPDQYFNIPLERRRKHLTLFRQYGVTHVFAGHYHRNSYGSVGSLQMVTSGPVGKPLGKDGSGLRVVTISDSGIEHQYYEFGFLPSKIDLAPSSRLRTSSSVEDAR